VVFSNAQIPKIATAVAEAPPALPALPAALPVSINTLCKEMGIVITLTASQRRTLGLSVLSLIRTRGLKVLYIIMETYRQ